MNITDEMVAAACYAWTRDSRPLQCEIDAMRAALAAALAAQPQPAEQWLDHIYAGNCPDELQPDARDPNCPACRAMDAQPAEPVATVIKRGADRTWMSERLGGLPDGTYSLYLAAQPARVPQPVALPPLPTPTPMSMVARSRDLQYTAEQMTAYARAALAAADVTVAEGGANG